LLFDSKRIIERPSKFGMWRRNVVHHFLSPIQAA